HLQLNVQDDGISYINTLNVDILQCALDEINESDTDLLILCGDNTNSGKEEQHNKLIEMLNDVDKEILIVPGNHDLGLSGYSVFPEIYKDYGYGKAYSTDNESLSYSVVYQNMIVVILDTNNYDDKWETGIPSFDKSTLKWMESQFKYANDNNKTIITVGHYPILTRQTEEFTQQQEILNLFNKYHVRLYVAGHLHYHAVNKNNNLTELVVEQTTSYPVSYEILEINNNLLSVYSKEIDIEQWAMDNNLNNERLLNFREYLEVQYRKKCDAVLESLTKDKEIDEDKLLLAKDLFYKVMKYRSDGTLINHITEIENHEGYEYFREIAEGTIWYRWIPLVLSEANEYTMGFELNLKD
ncbi:MAG: metallophosphoesterase family protein, partial [Erysipelotrichaceae bacterium]